jgi:hypothetical protein
VAGRIGVAGGVGWGVGFGVGLTTTTRGKGEAGVLEPEFEEGNVNCAGGEGKMIVGDSDLPLIEGATVGGADVAGGMIDIESSAAGVSS